MQRAAIACFAEVPDALERRPKLAAIAKARRRKCPIVVAKLDRLSRDVAFMSGLMAQHASHGASLSEAREGRPGKRPAQTQRGASDSTVAPRGASGT